MEELCRAAYAGEIELVDKILNELGITPNGEDLEGKTPLWHAVSGRNAVPTVRRLIAGGTSCNWHRIDIKAPLMVAAENGQEELVKILLEAGADINITNGTSTVLSRAIASFWNPRVIQRLISEGANVNKLVKDNPLSMAPLHTACQFNRLEVISWLLEAGADPDIKTPDNAYGQSGCTPLYFAALSCPGRGAIDLLLGAGCNVNVQNEVGDTALHIAAVQGRIEIVEVLLKAGADASIKNTRGQTALQAASSRFNFYQFREDPLYTGDCWFPLIANLVAAGDRSWDCVPSPCPGLGRAMLPVFWSAPQDLKLLFQRLPKKAQERCHASLKVMHGPLYPEELRILILATALHLEEI